MIRVFVTDDSKLFRDGLCLFLRRHSDIEVAGVARDGQEAVELVPTLTPHVVLMDVRMPIMHGIEATRRILQQEHQPAVLIVAASFDRALVKQAMEAGARGYIAKHEFSDVLIPGIRAVASGKPYFSHSIEPISPG